MPFVIKNFRCFICHFNKTVRVPYHFKGVKCEICRSFNYFNYIPNYRKRKNINTNLSNNRRNRPNNIPINTNRINNNSNRSSNHLNFNTSNNVFLNNRNNDRIINIMNHSNRNINDENNILLNNSLENLFMNRYPIYNNHINLNTYFSNNLTSFNNDVNEKIKFPWLKRQKISEEIKKKYIDEKCSICLDELNGDISITKCHHIFHYKCICSYIDNTGKKDCPICRSNLQTGEKKKIEVNRNSFERLTYENNNIFNGILNINSSLNKFRF